MLTTDREEARRQVNTHPTEAQCKAENYKMGHLLVNGFDISIENPKGSYRRGKDRNGKEWKTLMHHDYGYFRKTVGKDGDAVDVFLGPNLKSTKVFPIDQYINGQFDETKVMMGFDSKEEAKAAYLSNYEKDWKGFKYITEVDIDTFAKWLYDGHRQRKPFAKYAWLKEDKIDIRRILCEETGDDLFYDALENGHSVTDILWEFLDDKKEGRAQKHWRLIPANQYYNLLNRFMAQGSNANIPYNIVNGWFTQIIIPNTVDLENLTELCGHAQCFPFDDFANAFGEEWEGCNDYDRCSEYLEEIGFYDWCLLPDGSDAMSDYGLKPLFKIIKEYNSEMSPGEILVLINRALDVAHCRGDLSSMFIEGGSKTLSQISNHGLVSESKTGKNTYTIEIEFSGYYNEKKQRFSDAAVPEILDYLKVKKLEDVVVRMDYGKKNEISFDEVDLFCSKIDIKTLEYIPKQERSNSIAKITCDKQTGLSLIKLFMNLGAIGNCGHTFEVLIGKEEFCFDGDGSDRITSINGEKLRGEMLNRPDKWYEILKKGQPQENEPQFSDAVLREMIREAIKKNLKHVIKENSEFFNIKNVYHVSDSVFDEFKTTHFPYFFFSDKPININGNKFVYTCNLSMHKPFVFNAGTSWSYPLWLYLSTKEGNLIPEEEFTPEKFDNYLGLPYEFWKMVYYDDEEYEIDQIPDLVKRLNMGYDSVIIKDVQEGNTGIFVNDYIVFNPEQIQIVNKRNNR